MVEHVYQKVQRATTACVLLATEETHTVVSTLKAADYMLRLCRILNVESKLTKPSISS